MTATQIIEELYTGKNFNDCLCKMEPEHLREDLRQEVILVICELPEEKIIGMHERKELEFYTVRVILNMIQNRRNKFYKKFRQIHSEFVPTEISDHPGIEINERRVKELMEDLALFEVEEMRADATNNARWYAGELIAVYLQHGNYRAVAEQTQIPLASVFGTIKKSFEQIKENVNKPVFSKEELRFIQNDNK